MFPLCIGLCVLVPLLFGPVLSAITSSPGTKSVYEGDTVVFQWAFNSSAISFSFRNMTKTNTTSVRGSSDIKSGVATLTITNVTLWDAGKYSFTIDNVTDTNATIYVYQKPGTPYVDDDGCYGTFPVTENSSMYLRCRCTILSRPAGYNPQIIYEFTRDGYQITNSTARHFVSGSRLRIDPMLKNDHGRFYRCKCQELGSRLESNYGSPFKLSLHEFTKVSPSLQRKSPGDDCIMIWELTFNISELDKDCFIERYGPVHLRYPQTDYSFFSRRFYRHANIRYLDIGRTDYKRAVLSVQEKAVILYLTNLKSIDAGLYNLIIGESSRRQQQDTTVLYVYDKPSTRINVTPVSPVLEGQTIELTCSASSTSLPAAYSQPVIISWSVNIDGKEKLLSVRRSDGIVVSQDGDIFHRYSLVNDGRTLRITPVNHEDRRTFYCTAFEEGAAPGYRSTVSHYLNVTYRPAIVSTIPVSKRLNVPVPYTVDLSVKINFFANLTALFNLKWSFVNPSGVRGDVEYPMLNSDMTRMRFILFSNRQYGTYMCRWNYTEGQTEAVFQVLPQDEPETPINFRIYYVTSNKIFLQWNCSWDNGLQQYFTIQVIEIPSNVEIESKNITSTPSCLSNETIQVIFDVNIQPETEYEASLRSTNGLGSSNVTKLTIKTPKRPKFIIEPNDIVFNTSRVTISYAIQDGNAIEMEVWCCVDAKEICVKSHFNVSVRTGTITMFSIPIDTCYTFDFYLYDGPPGNYSVVAILRDIAVATDNRNCRRGSPGPAVIVLSVLLAISLVLGIGLWTVFFLRKYRNSILPKDTKKERKTKDSNVDLSPKSDEVEKEEVYENWEDDSRRQNPGQNAYECLQLDNRNKGKKTQRR